jgi:hypothetical protein
MRLLCPVPCVPARPRHCPPGSQDLKYGVPLFIIHLTIHGYCLPLPIVHTAMGSSDAESSPTSPSRIPALQGRLHEGSDTADRQIVEARSDGGTPRTISSYVGKRLSDFHVVHHSQELHGALLHPDPAHHPTAKQAVPHTWLMSLATLTKHGLRSLRKNFDPQARWHNAKKRPAGSQLQR